MRMAMLLRAIIFPFLLSIVVSGISVMPRNVKADKAVLMQDKPASENEALPPGVISKDPFRLNFRAADNANRYIPMVYNGGPKVFTLVVPNEPAGCLTSKTHDNAIIFSLGNKSCHTVVGWSFSTFRIRNSLGSKLRLDSDAFRHGKVSNITYTIGGPHIGPNDANIVTSKTVGFPIVFQNICAPVFEKDASGKDTNVFVFAMLKSNMRPKCDIVIESPSLKLAKNVGVETTPATMATEKLATVTERATEAATMSPATEPATEAATSVESMFVANVAEKLEQKKNKESAAWKIVFALATVFIFLTVLTVVGFWICSERGEANVIDTASVSSPMGKGFEAGKRTVTKQAAAPTTSKDASKAAKK